MLAGGKNIRLGRNKANELIGGKTLLERVFERLSPLVSEILLVTSRERSDIQIGGRARVIVDIYPEKGPLGGIYTGLLAAASLLSIAVACDMPFLNTGLLRYMVEQADDFDAVVPRLSEDNAEPLHAVYAKSCLDGLKARLEKDQLGLQPFARSVRVRYIERAECERFDPQLLSFFNINYPADLDRAITLAKDS